MAVFAATLVLISAGGIYCHFNHFCLLFAAVFTAVLASYNSAGRVILTPISCSTLNPKMLRTILHKAMISTPVNYK